MTTPVTAPAAAPAAAIHPSILNCDIAHLAEELARIEGADGVHVDVMDNHFVPNLSWGLPVVEAVVAHTSLPVDAHLMIEDPDRWGPAYAEAGCQIVTAHSEALVAPVRLARELHRLGAGAGIALRPSTPLEAVEDILGEFDLLLIMTVEPGFGGQAFIESMLPKIERARRLVGRRGLELRIQVDGGISASTIERAAQAGAEVFVAGSAVYGAQDALAAIEQLRALARTHAHGSRSGPARI
ncbi:MAG: ribulose-phosphate 3-epimerase [Actinomyces bowdenii]|nr:ribulose-phosphate 3-epimerase [Actinomyces bowdenii]